VRPTGGSRGTYVLFPVSTRPEVVALVAEAARRTGALWPRTAVSADLLQPSL
jgi:hypothetical protein